MATLPLSEARRHFDLLPDRLSADPEQEVVITEDGRPTMVVLSWDRYESLRETDEVRRDRALTDAIRQGVQEIEEGRGLRWDEAKRRLGWP